MGAARVELGLVVEVGSLEPFLRRFREVFPETNVAILDEAFGRSLTVRDPDGLELSVIEQEVELYTAER